MKGKNGFTLIEILLYVSILGIMLTAVSGFVVVVIDARIKQHTIAEVELQGVQLTELLDTELRQAASVLTPLSGQTASQLVFTRQGDSATSTVDVVAGQLRLAVDGGSPTVLTSSHVQMSDLSITNLATVDSADSLRIQFRLAYTGASQRQVYVYSTVFTTAVTLHQLSL